MPSSTKQRACRILRGFFVLRACKAPTTYVCPSCERAACREHRRQVDDRLLCIECAVRAHDPTKSDEPTGADDLHTPAFSTYFYAYSGDDAFGAEPGGEAAFSGAGGAFGGGGAGSDWDEAAGVYAYRDQFYDQKNELTPFTEADFQAFDQLGAEAYDETDDGGFFDS